MLVNFWNSLSKPIIGLSPMDGVTDAPFRYLTAKHGKPAVMFTEFVATEGLCRGIPKLLEELRYDEIERPIVAQVFGSEPETFYKVAHLVCELGFDGMDINMGCPAKNVADRGCGAALILDPERAKKIIREAKRGVQDWVNGQTLEQVGFLKKFVKRLSSPPSCRASIPVSVKTRIGYDNIVITDWVQHLLEAEPVVISIHGRTLKQMYRGDADWEAIAQAAALIRQTNTLVLGNGDVKSREEALTKVREAGVDGVLIGRAAMGNPWIFAAPSEIAPPHRLDLLLEHAKIFEALKKQGRFSEMYKFIKAYCHGFPDAAEMREKLYKSRSAKEVTQILNGIFTLPPPPPLEGGEKRKEICIPL